LAGSDRKYEKKMFVRAEEKMRETYNNLETIFAKDAPRSFAEMMKAYGPPPHEET
jgi:hypothetical protein